MILDAARVAPEKAVLRPALPMFLRPGWNGTNVGTKRKTISKTTRFEVFKRDGFKCQYCGSMAPDVLEALRAALATGCPIDEMEREAKRCTTWRRYQDWLLGIN